LLLDNAKEATRAEGFKAQIYKAISVQRPVVLGYLKSIRREKPDASAVEILKELDRRYVATVTATSTGVGASAAIPGFGIPVALGLGVADLLFFYETSALYVLAVAELHGVEVSDAARAQPLVFGMLLGKKSQSKVAKIVLAAVPSAGGVDAARTEATGALGHALPDGWGEVLTQQLPDSALAPVATVLAREALRSSAKLGAGTLGKAVPFGVGAVIGGVGSFTFGRDVVKSARVAFPDPPAEFPPALVEFEKVEREPVEPSRALVALQSAAGGVAHFGEDLWARVTKATEAFRPGDLDDDGVPSEARALTAVKGAGTSIKGAGSSVKGAGTSLKGAAAGAAGAVGAAFRRKRPGAEATDDAPEEPTEAPADA